MSKRKVDLFWPLSRLTLSFLYLAERPQISMVPQGGVIILFNLMGRHIKEMYLQLIKVKDQIQYHS
ncbi:MAG: hypothetical protein H6Q63_499 [Firmicutes bacterium]|nr:hypothetical protein [Bacillota bacterium]